MRLVIGRSLFFVLVVVFGFVGLHYGLMAGDVGKRFEDVFRRDGGVVVLEEDEALVGSLRELQVDSDHCLWFLDSKVGNVKQYDGEGKFLKAIGGKGQGPGEFVRPLAFWVDDENLLVGDPQGRKLHVFDGERKFVRFFKIRDCRRVRRIDEKRIVLGAAIREDKNRGACLHLFDMEKGETVRSFFSVAENCLKNRMIGDGVYFDVDGENDIYGVQEMEYRICKFSAGGKLLKAFGKPGPGYVAPPGNAFGDFLDRGKLTAWIKSWTHILGLFVVGDFVVVQMVNFGKGHDSYLLDIYSLAGKPVVVGIESRYRLLNADSKGVLYFVKEGSAADDGTGIVKFRIRKGKI